MLTWLYDCLYDADIISENYSMILQIGPIYNLYAELIDIRTLQLKSIW